MHNRSGGVVGFKLGNITGFMLFEYSIGSEWLELLKEIAPSRQASGSSSGGAAAIGVSRYCKYWRIFASSWRGLKGFGT
jgi:hypothetical protein